MFRETYVNEERPTAQDVRAVLTTDREEGIRVSRAIGLQNPMFREAARSHFVSYARYGG